MNPKELIVKIKEYADIADATYAMLHYVEENEEITPQTIREDNKQIIKGKLPPSRWIYADGIKRGYEVKALTKEANDNHRSLGQPTAYALGIEARFAQEKIIDRDIGEEIKSVPTSILRNGSDISVDMPLRDIVKIDNTIQNFIKRKKETPELEKQKIKVSTTKEKMTKEEASHYLSYRTKTFTSRYELLHHQKNTRLGYSATLFLDTWARCEEEKYILAFRGTEAGRDFFNDVICTDGSLAFSHYNTLISFVIGLRSLKDAPKNNQIKDPALLTTNPQVASLVEHREVVFEIMRKLTKKEDFKLNLVGHSLGGNLAQCFCIATEDKYISSLYTYNAPGFGGVGANLINVFIRSMRVISGLVTKSVSKLTNPGFTRNTMENCVAYCTPNETLEDYIVYESDFRENTNQKDVDQCVKHLKESSKNNVGIDIHHIETISQPIPPIDSFAREYIQIIETTPSVISDLGFYKYGLPIGDKYNYSNTDKLHLLHIGGLKGFYYPSSHFMESTLQITYFYDYLLKQKDNKNKQVFCGEIADAFNYLASYTQILIDIISCGKLLKHKRDRSYLLAYFKEIYHPLTTQINNNKNSPNNAEISFGEDKEKIDFNDFKDINSNNILDAIMVLDACAIYTKIIDKYDAEIMGG